MKWKIKIAQRLWMSWLNWINRKILWSRMTLRLSNSWKNKSLSLNRICRKYWHKKIGLKQSFKKFNFNKINLKRMRGSATKGWAGSAARKMCKVFFLRMLMNLWISTAWGKIILFLENKEIEFKYKNKVMSQSSMHRTLKN